MADFDEKSGIVACPTSWGLWYQTLDEVSIEVKLSIETKTRNIQVNVPNNTTLNVKVHGNTIVAGELFNSVRAKEMIWTIEDHRDEGRMLRIVLPKVDKTAINTWPALLKDDYKAEDWLLDNMRKKAFLEKMQLENEGFDLSGSEVTGNYATGGPDIPS